MESGQYLNGQGQASSSTAGPTPGSSSNSSKKRNPTSRPSSPVLRKERGVKEESPEPELDEVSLQLALSLLRFKKVGERDY